jgi:hypothetical protein
LTLIRSRVAQDIVRVGWLNPATPFETGPVTQEFLRGLLAHYRERKNQTRGFHRCPFYENPKSGLPVEINGEQVYLGSAEIHVEGMNGQLFVAPDLLLHYKWSITTALRES